MPNKQYDGRLLAELIGRGDATHADIAGKVGVSRSLVTKVAAGIERADLQPLIHAFHAGAIREAQRAAARWLRPLLLKHIRVGLADDGETGRRCREFVIQVLVASGASSEAAAREGAEAEGERRGKAAADRLWRRAFTLEALSDETKDRIIRDLGGPEEDGPPMECGLPAGRRQVPAVPDSAVGRAGAPDRPP